MDDSPSCGQGDLSLQGGTDRFDLPACAAYGSASAGSVGLDEEVGSSEADVQVLHQTDDWLHYRLPENFIRQHSDPLCIGQKQKWFLLSLEVDDSRVELSKTEKPEFDDWRWVNFWYPVDQVIEFKRDVYRKALQQLETPLSSYIGSSIINC